MKLFSHKHRPVHLATAAAKMFRRFWITRSATQHLAHSANFIRQFHSNAFAHSGNSGFMTPNPLTTPRHHSHSIVPGGLLVTSYTTRLTPLTSLMMRVAMRPRKAGSNI